MNDLEYIKLPPLVEQIYEQTQVIGFELASEPRTGSLLRMLAASKLHGRFLEIGTGTGYGTAWILDGMDPRSTLESVDKNPDVQAVARQYLGTDARLSLYLQDAIEFLSTRPRGAYDFIFADTLPGKFEGFDITLDLLKPGGILILDDLLPQRGWQEGHPPKVERLLEELNHLPGYCVTKLNWATGIVLLTRMEPS